MSPLRLTRQDALATVERAQRAPSILNTQPWRWRLREDGLELYADRDRQVFSVDPDARLLTVSCGAALHHARAAFHGAGYEVAVHRWPYGPGSNLLARLSITGYSTPTPTDVQILRDIQARRSDRRPSAATVAVPVEALSHLCEVARDEHASLHLLNAGQQTSLGRLAREAAIIEMAAPGYLTELHAWTHRPWAGGDGVTTETVTAQVSRPVALRDFSLGHGTGLDPGLGDDRFARFLVVATRNDDPRAWLTAGEATSAVWLAATAAGLAVSVTSDVVEVSDPRDALRDLIDHGGWPQLVLRVATDMQPPPFPRSPRRPPSDVVDDGA